MTGFGRFEVLENDKKFIIELKSVNHRYFDVNIRMPKKLNLFESAIRSLLKEYAERGKIDMYITYEDASEGVASLKYNSELAKEYFDYYKKMSEELGIENDAKASVIARSPEVLTMEEQTIDEDELWKILEKCIRGASEKFVEARKTEGEHLKNDLLAKLDHLNELVDFVEKRSPVIVEEYKTKVEEKVKELLGNTQIDDSRIAMEVTLFADKVCVDEEIVRLKSHIKNMKAELEKGGGVGRKLDFIAQEMNREANTTLSKTSDIEISSVGIEMKTEIEKIREQIQNIE